MELRCCGATARQLLACHVVSPRAARPGVAASECDLVEGGLRAYVIAYTTTQRLGVVVQLHANLCAFVPANSGSLPLVGCYQCAASGKAGGCSSSFGVRAGAQRAGPSSCAGFFLLANRQLLCDRYARVDCCDFVPANRGILPLLWRSLHPWGSNVRRGPDFVRRLHTKMRGTEMHTPFSYPFTRSMSWSVYPTNEGSLTYELAEESVVTRRCPGLFISQHLGCVGWYEGCACAALAWGVCPIARRCDLSGDVFSEALLWVAYLHASYGAGALRFE